MFKNTKEKMTKVQRILEGLNPSQLSGLGCLAFLALREKTSLLEQWEEMRFSDISESVIEECDEYDAMQFISAIARRLAEISSTQISLTNISKGNDFDLAELLD
jgi:hypothetical protein